MYRIMKVSLVAAVVGITNAAADDVDVVIVGGGLAGLNAGRILSNTKKKVIVLEARDEVGGRTNTQTGVSPEGETYWIDNGK